MPLQHASAHVARSFAIHLGHTLTPDHLRLMFTPEFGMFIAPGCDGIRGSVTMGLVALIAGYIYRFRWYANALVVVGAVLLGYVFNLGRLCMLVLYYMVALHFPSLQDKAENADYVIGGVLFLVATLLLFVVIHHLRDAGERSVSEQLVDSARGSLRVYLPRGTYAQLGGMAAVVLLGWAGSAWAGIAFLPPADAGAALPVEHFPEHEGNYTLERTWAESLATGAVVYYWAQYAPSGGGTPIAIGVSPIPDWHDPSLCRSVRGETPLWQGQLSAPTLGTSSIEFSSALYSDGVTQSLEASTMCRNGVCGEFASERSHLGLIYSGLDSKSLLKKNQGAPIRLLLHAETMDTSLSKDTARAQLTESLGSFLASVRLGDLTQPYSK
jgi:exosortase J